MTLILISYDVHPLQGEAHEKIARAIQELGAWWHHLETTWILRCERTPSEVRDALADRIGANDQLLVLDISCCKGAWLGINDFGEQWLTQALDGPGGGLKEGIRPVILSDGPSISQA
jgi:hypothetical protein